MDTGQRCASPRIHPRIPLRTGGGRCQGPEGVGASPSRSRQSRYGYDRVSVTGRRCTLHAHRGAGLNGQVIRRSDHPAVVACRARWAAVPVMTVMRADRRQPSLLVVTTVAPTHGFLLPFARHFRTQGWRVDGCANGIAGYGAAVDAYDATYELPLSRSLRDFRGMSRSIRALRSIVARDYDIVHVHTPIAAFLARAVIRRSPSADRPRVVYTAHGFHFHEGGHPLTNRAFIVGEQVAGRWTDRLIVINREDYEAARRYKIVQHDRLRYMRGIGVDTDWYSRAQPRTRCHASCTRKHRHGSECALLRDRR